MGRKMKTKKLASIYSMFIGSSVIVMWIVFYITDGIPEIKTKPIEFGLHLTAELITAVLLLVGGYGLLKNKKWGLNVYFISMGMLFYTLIMSPGYFLQNGEVAFLVMFIIFIILAAFFVCSLLFQKDKLNLKREANTRSK